MSAYVLANLEVKNPEDYQEYVRRNSLIVPRYGGRFVARGGTCDVLEGDWDAYRVVLIEFPDCEAARAWYNSPEYQEILPIRHGNAQTHTLAIIEGA